MHATGILEFRSQHPSGYLHHWLPAVQHMPLPLLAAADDPIPPLPPPADGCSSPSCFCAEYLVPSFGAQGSPYLNPFDSTQLTSLICKANNTRGWFGGIEHPSKAQRLKYKDKISKLSFHPVLKSWTGSGPNTSIIPRRKSDRSPSVSALSFVDVSAVFESPVNVNYPVPVNASYHGFLRRASLRKAKAIPGKNAQTFIDTCLSQTPPNSRPTGSWHDPGTVACRM
jgi:hypothetical protein